MIVRIKLVQADGSERQIEFDRKRIKVGRGPSNDLVVDDFGIARHVGDIEIDVDAQSVAFACADANGETVHRRAGIITPSDMESTWSLEEGDVISLGHTAITIEAITVPDAAELHWLPVVNLMERSETAETGFARLVESIAHSPEEGTILRAACGLLQRHTHHRPRSISLMRLGSEQEYRRETLTLEPSETPTTLLAEGKVSRTVDPVRRPGPLGLELLAGLRGGKCALFKQTGAAEVFVPLSRHGVTFAVLGFEIGDATSDDVHEAAIVAQEIAPLAWMTLTHLDLEAEKASIAEENRYFRERERRHYLFKELIAESAAMRSAYQKLTDMVDADHPVLIVGDAGSGKELLARAVHHLGKRKDAMMISLNCGKLSGVDIDLELFGSIANGVTGAAAPRKGVFELARNGTVYLEEIDLLSPLVQGKLLRMINEDELRRVGDAIGRPVSSRLVCSVHRNLDQLVDSGVMRRDLYLALKDHILPAPTLAERTEDLMPLARIFMRKFAERYGLKVHRIHPDAAARLQAHPWPGNARELQARMEAAVLRCGGDELLPEHLSMD